MLSQAASSPQPQNDLQSLTQEVRRLRAALERTASAGLRVQLALHRLERQQEAMQKAQERVLDVERQISFLKSETEQTDRQTKHLEGRKAKEPGLEPEIQVLKSRWESLQSRQPELETRLAEARHNLRTEAAKLDGLNKQVDDIEL
jgi:predicted  nucleic acid-binding Zn-ribbon protein